MGVTEAKAIKEAEPASKAGEPLSCGLIMPISTLDVCSAEHWLEVKSIISEAIHGISDPRFTVRLVSDADDVGVIQKRIVQNVYTSDIVVCDVSAKNPNVMFELGMRLAFDKPTVIVKDDKTEYSFDTGVIEHIGYPRDLRFGRMVAFKQALAEKLVATYKTARDDPKHSTFLKNFGTFTVASIGEKQVTADQAILEAMSDMQREIASLRNEVRREISPRIRPPRGFIEGRAKILAALDELRSKNPTFDPQSPNAEHQLEIACMHMPNFEPQSYFRNPEEFRVALRDALERSTQ